VQDAAFKEISDASSSSSRDGVEGGERVGLSRLRALSRTFESQSELGSCGSSGVGASERVGRSRTQELSQSFGELSSSSSGTDRGGGTGSVGASERVGRSRLHQLSQSFEAAADPVAAVAAAASPGSFSGRQLPDLLARVESGDSSLAWLDLSANVQFRQLSQAQKSAAIGRLARGAALETLLLNSVGLDRYAVLRLLCCYDSANAVLIC
jgi:hypothetical protein